MLRFLQTTIFIALICVSVGCKVDRPKIPKVISTGAVSYELTGTDSLSEHRTKFNTSLTQNTTTGDNDARIARDTMINYTRRDIQAFYSQYEVQVASSRRNFA